MVYGLLPNKTQDTYTKFFRKIDTSIKVKPLSINVDFEKAVFNAIKEVFNCRIQACFFHLSQSFFRRVQTQGYLNDYYSNEDFRLFFKMIQFSFCSNT